MMLLASSCSRAELEQPVELDRAPDRGGSTRLVQSADQAERISAVPVRTTAAASGKRVLLSVPLVVEDGQLLLVVAEFQVTNEIDANIFVGSQIVLARDPDATAGRAVTQASGYNVTPDMHHGQQTRTGLYEAVRADEGRRYVNLVVWAASSRAVSEDGLTVDRGYCRLSVTGL